MRLKGFAPSVSSNVLAEAAHVPVAASKNTSDRVEAIALLLGGKYFISFLNLLVFLKES